MHYAERLADRGVISSEQREQIDAEIRQSVAEPDGEAPVLREDLADFYALWAYFGPPFSMVLGFAGGMVLPELARLAAPREALLDRCGISEPGLRDAILDLWGGLDVEEVAIQSEILREQQES